MARRRATAVVVRDNTVLLVRDRGKHSFSLPGGGIHRGEPAISAAARELYEETGLEATSIRYLFAFSGGVNKHRVFLIEATGKVRIRSELDKFIWWGEEQEVPLFPHVTRILHKLHRAEDK